MSILGGGDRISRDFWGANSANKLRPNPVPVFRAEIPSADNSPLCSCGLLNRDAQLRRQLPSSFEVRPDVTPVWKPDVSGECRLPTNCGGCGAERSLFGSGA